jgi:RHS repeat-associated protein
VVVGTAQQLQAIFTDANNAPVANSVITFTVTGPNATTGTATTDSSGKAKFVYSGAASGVDSIVASVSAGSTTLNSNTSTINWVVPAQPISTTTINGRIFASNGSGPFNTPPTATPAFVQNFPTINFNPPSGTVPGMPGSIGVNTRPFTDVTTDLNGNFTGSIVVQGNGLQAGVGALFNFQAVFTGSYTVAAAGDVTFNFFSDDGFIFGVNNGATRVSGSLFNPPPSGLTPFQGYPVMGAFNTATAPVANSITVHFPGPGTYQYEIDYSECCAGELAVTMTSSLSGNHGVPSSGTVTLTPGTNVSKSIGGTATFSALLTDASGAIIPNVPVLFNVAGANTIQFQGVSDSTGHATFSYQGFRTGTDIVQANAQITGMTAVSNQTLVTWNSAANTAPVVNAGTNQTITLPVNSATLNGTATDDGLPNGTLTTTWTQISGPAQAAIANPNQMATVVSFTQPGSYVFKLTASDSVLTSSANVTITVNQQNLAPFISISVDSTVITQPANTVHVTGTVTDDGFPTGSTLTTQWTQVSGPSTATFSNPTSPNTTITFPAAGTYVLKLSASDSQLTSSVSVTITVNPPAPNQAPTVAITASQTLITLPSNVVTLAGKISDDGLPLGAAITTQWSQVSGPLPVTFSTPASSSTQVGFPAAGTYVLQLAASDSQLTGSSTISITVNAVGTNQAPTVAIIADHTSITLPTNTVTLNGVINDDGLPNGTISTQWAQISGPATVNIAQVTSTSVKVSCPAAGVYVIKLTANDGQLSSEATIAITVTTSGGNQPPTVSAGPSQSLQLPQNTLTLTGYAADDGLPTGSTLLVNWSEISGPASVLFSNPSSVVTQASFPVAGVYVLQLSASDSQLQTTAQVTVTVVNAPVPPPTPPSVSFTGFADGQEITKPTPIIGSVTTGNWKLEYSLLDGAGNPTTFVTFASGAAPVTNTTLGTFDPTVLLNGQYVVRFSSTDNAGQTSTTSSTVDVSRNTKVGNFTLSFNDLSVPLPGLPITITRTYDSRDKRVGDFGVGWTLSVANVRVQKTGGALGSGWEESQQWSGFFPTYCLQPIKNHTVSVTFPDGKVYKFQAINTPQCQQLVPIDAPQIGFTQISTGSATAGATLTPIGDTDLFIDAGIPGPVNLITAEIEFADFTQFQLTTAEGFTYILDQKLGATSVIDPNGNTLTINASGVISSAGANVTFSRDTLGRITQITDPAGHNLVYSYTSSGDLSSFTDAAGNSTTFLYDSTHLLTDIIDPRGIQAIKNTYDAEGRLISTTDGRGNTITFTRDLAANHETVTDRLGNLSIYEYDDDGNVLRETDPLGNVSTFTYDANDNKLTATNPLGKTSTYTYDVLGNRTSETDPLGNRTTYTYNSQKQPLTITDALGNVTTNTYDKHGNLLNTKDPLGNVTSYTYNSQGLPLTMTDASGKVTSFAYDGAGHITQQTDALGNIQTFTYDANGNRITQAVTRTKSDGTRDTLTTQYEYDGNNRLVKTTNPDGSFTRNVYDPLGKLSASIDALGRTTQYDYDNNGHLVKTTYADSTNESVTYDANDRPLTMSDRGGRTTSYLYDQAGRLTKTTYPDGTALQSVFDAAGRTIQNIDPLGNTTTYGYDDADRRTSITDALGHTRSFAYDKAGNQISLTDPLGHVTQFAYDASRRLLKTTYPDLTTESMTYDVMHRRTSKVDEGGKTTQYGYDAIGRLNSVTDALGQQTRYVYDELGNRTAQIDANTHTTSFAYDQMGRLTSRKLPLGMQETFTYDAAANMISRTDFAGRTTTFTYDSMNRLTAKSADPFLVANHVGASQISFTYTATGKRASMTDPSGATTYTYDSRDRLLTKATPFGTLTYTHDAAGNVLTLSSSNSNGSSMSYTYDPLNRLASVTDAAGSTSYTYDADGNLAGYAYPNGVSTTYSYNTRDRLTNMQSICAAGTGCGAPGTPLASYAYTLGPAGNRLTVAELGGRHVQYGYDSLYRLTSEAVSADPAGANGTVSYTYDPAGNRVQRNSTLAAIPATGLLNYDANDRSVTDAYDDNGNLLSGGVGSNVYDFETRLVQAGNVTIVYDGDGNRVAETVAGVTTNYLLADQNATGYAQVMEELQGGVVVRAYSYGLALTNERQTLGNTLTTSFYGYDGHGSVRFLTDATGAITDTYNYDAFGSLLSHQGSTPNNYLFAGEQFDPVLGIYYNRARYYDQRNGRFWTMDTNEGMAAEPLSLHKYVYSRNNPVDRIDPSGHQDLISTMEAEDISEELDAENAEAEFAVKKALTAHVVDIYSCSKLQAYIIPIHCWVYANQPGNVGLRYDIGAEPAQRGPGLIIGSVSGFLLISPTNLADVEKDANLRFSKEASISELGFIEWQAAIVAEFEFLGVVDDALKYATNYSFNTVTQDAVNCITFTGFAIGVAKRIEASGH